MAAGDYASPRDLSGRRDQRSRAATSGVRTLWRQIDARQPLANGPGKVRAAVGLLCALSDSSACFELLERIVLIEATYAVHVFRQVPRQQQAIIERQMSHDALHHVIDQR